MERNGANERKLWNIALGLSIVTIAYNIVEGLVSVFFGVRDETLSLFGFGVDSFIEVLSGIGILRMVFKVRKNDYSSDERFERSALIVTGTSFMILALGLAATAIVDIVMKRAPETTVWGIIVSSISILSMMGLYLGKRKIGKALKSDAIIADANCTKTCIYLSFILLAASLLYHFLGVAYVDSIAALGIAVYAVKEGKESLEAAGKKRRA
jgi:divalent metal cation (Fe/Co/Zn/Cd) transporter